MSGVCPSCAEPTLAGASFCEACGADLAEVAGRDAPVVPEGNPACASCDAPGTEIEGDYCLRCGHRQPDDRDHLELRSGRIAGVTDRGRRHHRNEDAMAFTDTGDAMLVVVCDGVSTTDNPHLASQAAADAAIEVLSGRARAGTDRVAALVDATAAARHAVLEVPPDVGNGNPSCTFVAAVVTEPDAGQVQVDVAWLGDSRAYWVGRTATLLTTDHSWAHEVAEAGVMSLDEALRDARAHTITRWLGADAPAEEPQTAAFTFSEPGAVLMCTDGLWNYAPEAETLAALPEFGADDPLAVAAALAEFANRSGGHDNITVVIADPAADPAGVQDARAP